MEVVSLNAYLSAQRVTKTADEFQTALDRLSTIVLTLKADAGFLIDTGAEKVFIIDEKGQRISNDVSLLMIANLVMREHRSGHVGAPVNVSRVIEALAQPQGVSVQRLRTAPRYIMEASRQKDAISGRRRHRRFYFPGIPALL